MIRSSILLLLMMSMGSGCDVLSEDDPPQPIPANVDAAVVSPLDLVTRDSGMRTVTLLNSWQTTANRDGDVFPVQAMVTLSGVDAAVSLWTSQRHLYLHGFPRYQEIPSVHDSKASSLIMMSARRNQPVKLEMDVDVLDDTLSYVLDLGGDFLEVTEHPSKLAPKEFWHVLIETPGGSFVPANQAFDLEVEDGEYFRLKYYMRTTLVIEIPIWASAVITDPDEVIPPRELSLETARLQLVLTAEP